MIKAALLLLIAGPLCAAGPKPADLERAQAETGLIPQLASWLPKGYSFESVEILPYHGHKIIHFRYKAGKEALSLFQLPPRVRLDFGAKSREKVSVSGKKGFYSETPDGNVLGWSVKGGRFALVGPLSLDILKRIAESVK